MADLNDILNEKEVLYIFGYGSLTWKPDFNFTRRLIGYIQGYERRFWQGSTYHRGTIEKPGRCATLTKVNEGVCWGLIYEVRGTERIAEALDYLNVREQALGGYEIYVVPVYTPCNDASTAPMYSIVYVATPACRNFLGDATIEELAQNIASSAGEVGHNIEYLFRLVDFMVKNLPNEKDEHLYSIDSKVREMIGVHPTDRKSWFELLEEEWFRKLVHPRDYKEKWRNAIKTMMSKTHSIDRWTDLLRRIKNMKESGGSKLEKIDLSFV